MEKLAQDNETMFERNIAIIASRRNEVMVYSDSFVYEGFLCGLDSKWVQIYGHEENEKEDPSKQWRFVLLNKDEISGIVPTGRTINDIDEEVKDYISKKIRNFSEVSDMFLSVRGFKNDGRKEKH